MTVPVNAAVKFTLYRIFSQAFLPPCEVFVSTLSHLCCCFPQVRRGDTILAQLFYPVTMTPQIWVTTELCDRSDADELFILKRCSFCAHWNAESNNMEGK